MDMIVHIAGTSAEVILPNGTALCSIEDLPENRDGHTQNGLTVCGGYTGYDYTLRSCIQYKEGSWNTLVDDLEYERHQHMSWMMNQEGDTMLIGGSYSPTRTEIVYQNGTSIRSFDLKYSARYVSFNKFTLLQFSYFTSLAVDDTFVY